MTFVQMLMAIEDMQSMQRAEAGIKEIVIGYLGHDNPERIDELDASEVETLATELGGQVIETNVADLPDDVRAVFLAEQHRKRTGEVRPSKDFSEN